MLEVVVLEVFQVQQEQVVLEVAEMVKLDFQLHKLLDQMVVQ
jgi:hypothetical protein